MGQFRKILYIALNNLRLFVTDRIAVVMFILFPFLFIMMFNLLLGNIGRADTRLELHLVSLENSGLSQQIIEALETRDEASLKLGDPKIIREKNYDQAKKDVEEGKLAGFLLFPSNFTQAVMTGNPARLEIVAGIQQTNTRMALQGLAQTIISGIETQRAVANSIAAIMAQQGAGQAEIQQALAQIFSSGVVNGGSQSLISFQIENYGEVKPVNVASYIVPGYLVMFVFFAAAIASADIIKERRNHTLERLLSISVKKESILWGIYLGAVSRGLVQIAIFWLMGILVFKIDLGIAPWAVILISLLMVLLSAAFSVMLATLVKTDRSAAAIAVLVSLVLAPLGGCWWPLFITPQWMQYLAKFTPHGWANTGFNKLMLFGASPGSVVWEMIALAGFMVIFMTVAVINFRTSSDVT